MPVERKKVRFGLIGLGLMGREFASATARWCHLLDDGPVPVISAICSRTRSKWSWFLDNFPSISLATDDYRELAESDAVDAVYAAVPHSLHADVFTAVIEAGKHLLGEKPFGIDLAANRRIVEAARARPEIVVMCCSEFPYFPGAQRLVRWARERRYGRLIEIRAGFYHCSDMDPHKPINWKRQAATNGEYGCLGDLGMHTQHIPFRLGWIPRSVYGSFDKIVRERPDGRGGMAPCDTWDNATLLCRCEDRATGWQFPMILETRRMAPGHMNTWFIEVYGTEESARFSTKNPKSFCTLKRDRQAWCCEDVGSQSIVPTVSGGIFEFGFSDAFLQMVAAFMNELRDVKRPHPFGPVTLEETVLSHRLMTAALESHRSGRRVDLPSEPA